MPEQPSFPPQPGQPQPQYGPPPQSQPPYPDFRQYPFAAGSYGVPAPTPMKSRKLPIILGTVTAGLVLVGGGVTALVVALDSDAGQQVAAVAGVPVVAQVSPFPDVQTRCDSTGLGTTIADDGKTLIIDSAGEEDISGVSYDSMNCIFDALKMPAAVQEHVGETRALDGRQEDSWDGFTASWSYHPNQGCDMILRVA